MRSVRNAADNDDLKFIAGVACAVALLLAFLLLLHR
jgi:hypothetical protein